MTAANNILYLQDIKETKNTGRRFNTLKSAGSKSLLYIH